MTPIFWNSVAGAAAALAPNIDANGGAWVLVKVDTTNPVAAGNGPTYRSARFAPGANGARDVWLDGANWPHWHRDLSGSVIGWAFIE